MPRQLSPVTTPPAPAGMSLSEILELPVMRQVRLVAGGAGLGARVSGVTLAEAVPALPRAPSHHLLLTERHRLDPQDTGSLTAWVGRLADDGVAAVALSWAGERAALPPEAVAEADRRALPVLAVPTDLGVEHVARTVLTAVVSRRADTLARAEHVLQDLVGVVIAGGDLDQVCQGVVRHLATTALVTTMDGRVLACAGEVPARLADLPGFDPTGRFRVETERPGVSRELDGSHRLVAQLPAGGTDGQLGRLVLLRQGAFTAEDDHVVGRATTAAALALTRDQAVAAVEGRYRGDFLRDALLGRAGDPDRVAAHAADLGWDLRRPLAVVVAEADEAPADDAGTRTLPERFRAAWERVVAADDDAAAVAGFSREVVLLLGVPAGLEPAGVTDRVGQIAAQVHGRGGGGRRTFATGISRTITDLADLPRAYAEARKAVQVGRRLYGERAVTHFDALGVFRLLSQVEDRQELDSFVSETLGRLGTDTSEEAQDLRTTLSVLLDNNLNVASTARALHFHYNSLRYRIGKLERMLGPFTTDPRLRFAIMLALQARQLDHP